MDFRDSALVATAGLALTFAVLFAGAAGFLVYRNRTLQEQEAAMQALAQANQARRMPTEELHGRTFAERARAAARIEELKRALDQKNRLLESKTRQLNRTVAEYEKLRMEMNESFAGMLELMSATPPPPDPNQPVPPDAPPAPPAAPGETELAAARQELLDWQQNQELEQLRNLLLDTTDELTRLQADADREMLLLTDELLQFRGLTADTLVQIGPPAIPILTSYLQDGRPAVRRWAAEMLAEFGPAAEEALPALQNLTTDLDPQVQAAAAQATAAIRP